MQDTINFLGKLYLCVYNDKKTVKFHLEKEILSPLCIDVQERILAATVKNPRCVKYPPPIPFKKMFLRLLCDTVEMYASEFSDELLKEYTEIMSLSSDDLKSDGYHTYLLKENYSITLKEDNCFVAKSTTGLQTWEASKYLSEWCINNSSKLKNQKILELGSGVGLLGITVLLICEPNAYIFTDKSWEVLKVLSSNIKINLSDPKNYNIQQIQLVWSTICKNDAVDLSPDILLGADLVYDKSMVESLVHALKIFLTNRSTCAYIASTIRDPDTDYKFIHYLDLSGLTHEVIKPLEKSIFIYNPPSTFVIYKIQFIKRS